MPASGLDNVRTRLVLLFFAITATAIGFVYLYVVPQLESSLDRREARAPRAAGGRGARPAPHRRSSAGSSSASWRRSCAGPPPTSTRG